MLSLLAGIVLSQISSPDLPPLPPREMAWWQDAKFGMFIHWGVYAIPARGEWYMNNEHVAVDRYRKLGEQFNPLRYDPAQWVKIARDAGMNYMVLTARHHDGYALWDSQASIDGFTSMQMAAKRDLVKQYVDACRNAKMRVGLYYSLMDWRIPGYYKPRELPESAQALKRQCYGQVEELTHRYGKIDVLWYDGGWLNMQGSDADAAWLWEPVKLNQIVRRNNPGTVINPRSGWEGDFDCDEGGASVKGPIRSRPWEKCLNLNQTSWGFNRAQNLMSFDEIVGMLVNVVVRNGNMLLNVGPDADGVIPPSHAARLAEVGAWLHKYGASIYKTRGGPLPPVDGVYGTTFRGKTIYVHWRRGGADELTLPALKGKVLKSTVLTGGSVRVEQNESGVKLRLADAPAGLVDTIVRLDTNLTVTLQG